MLLSDAKYKPNIFCLPAALSQAATAEEIVRGTALDGYAARFENLFGAPPPAADAVVAIHTHSSAVPLVDRFVGNAQRVEALTEIGEYALYAAVAVMVYKESPADVTAEEIDAKVGYICSSESLVSNLNSRRMCNVIVGKGMIGSMEENDCGACRMCQGTAARLIGHLYLTRRWERVLTILTPLNDLQGSFPLNSYRDSNAKSVLQHATQAIYGTVPTYQVISQDGPDHKKTFTVQVRSGKNGRKTLGLGTGRSVREAEKAAASASLPMLPRIDREVKVRRITDPFPEWLQSRCDNVGPELVCAFGKLA